jgi:hypothetical protein
MKKKYVFSGLTRLEKAWHKHMLLDQATEQRWFCVVALFGYDTLISKQ